MLENLLPLFPIDSGSITVTATVWIGVVVAVFFNLRFGWTLSAIVVPGYIVPLLISRPITAVVIFFEAIVTYLIVRCLSDAFRRMPYWSSLFGRDRFFAIVVVSVIVRSTFDGWLLPEAGRYVVENLNWNFDYRNELQSFGLIVVALIANYFWKPGLRGGFVPAITGIAVTWLLVVFVVGHVTNLNLSNFHLLYEDISASLLASPKSYIILITTACLASWINLRYAWDFNGILVPALLGIALQDPSKLVSSAFESVAILVAAVLIRRLPLVRDYGLEGGRKLLFFFSICFALRLSTSHIIPVWFPGYEVTDVYGLGYLLSTLMAIKAYDTRLILRMLKGTLQVALIGGVAGSVAGFLLVSMDLQLRAVPRLSAAEPGEPVVIERDDRSVSAIVLAHKPLLYELQRSGSYKKPTFDDLSRFRAVLRELQSRQHPLSQTDLSDIGQMFNRVNYRITRMAGGEYFLHESSPANGWGMYVVDPSSPGGLCLEVPSPLEEYATLESALTLSRRFPTGAIAIAGASPDTNIDRSADVTQNSGTMFAVFHEMFGQQQTVQVRGVPDSQTATESDGPSNPTSKLYVRRALPESMPLRELKRLAGDLEIIWNQSPFHTSWRNRIHRSDSWVELAMDRTTRQRLMVMAMVEDPQTFAAMARHSKRLTGRRDSEAAVGTHSSFNVAHRNLSGYLVEIKENIHRMGSDLYVPASMEEMLFIDKEVVTPLINLVGRIPSQPKIQVASGDADSEPPSWISDEVRASLTAINSSASVQGYRIEIVVDTVDGESVIVLREDATTPERARGWGTYLFRPAMELDLTVEVPRPLFESHSLDFGLSLFRRPGASALLIAGAHPLANRDGTSDISQRVNRQSLFNLVRQVIFREMGDRPLLVAQARAIQAPVEYDIAIATDEGETRLDQLSPLKRSLTQSLIDDRFSIGFVDGSRATAGYELGVMMRAMALQISDSKEFVSLWLSPSVRTKYQQHSIDDALSAQAHACGIATVNENLSTWVARNFQSASDGVFPRDRIDAQVHAKLRQYAKNYSVIQLLSAVRTVDDLEFSYVVDTATGQGFLVIADTSSRLRAIANLTGYIGDSPQTFNRGTESDVREFAASRSFWMEVSR